jgi:hypothetical protein
MKLLNYIESERFFSFNRNGAYTEYISAEQAKAANEAVVVIFQKGDLKDNKYSYCYLFCNADATSNQRNVLLKIDGCKIDIESLDSPKEWYHRFHYAITGKDGQLKRKKTKKQFLDGISEMIVEAVELSGYSNWKHFEAEKLINVLKEENSQLNKQIERLNAELSFIRNKLYELSKVDANTMHQS